MPCALQILRPGRPVLRPANQKASVLVGKDGFRKAFQCAARHDFVVLLIQAFEARGAPVDGKTDGIKDCGFARTDGSRKSKDSGVGKSGISEINAPFPAQRSEIFEMNLFYFHLGLYTFCIPEEKISSYS